MANMETYCICGQPYDSEQFMIQCDACKDWFHGVCIDLEEFEAADVDRYHCPRCAPVNGPSVFKIRSNWHRNNIYEVNAENKPVQSGTPVFITELSSRHFPSADEILLKMTGPQLTIPYLQRVGFNDPILIPQREGLGMIVPPVTFTVDDVEYYVGSERRIDVIDVTRQTGIRMKLAEFVKYFLKPVRTKVLNLISLEFTGTPLSSMVEAPYIARTLDWLNQVWPMDSLGETLERPQVEKYCLMSVKDSYTDFHVDFGGTSVWYHLLWGEKIFYLIKPTPANLSLYQRWTSSSNQSETFFGDQVDMCYKCVLKQGQTMLIPTGWIHAVLTPIDSLVFGGNFLHSLNMALQLRVYEIENSMKIAKKFLYPSFEKVNWYAARGLLDDIKQINYLGNKCPDYLLVGLKALAVTLKQWSQEKDQPHKQGKEEIPADIDAHKLLKDLNKEIRHAERFINSLNPPKPERESKRKKKKPANVDFVDISQSLLLTGFEECMEKSPVKFSIKAGTKKKELSQFQKDKPKSPIKLTLTKPPMQSCEPGAAVSYKVIPKTEKKLDLDLLNEYKDVLWKPWSVSVDSPLHMKIKTKVKKPKITSCLLTEKDKTVPLKSEVKTNRIPFSDSIYDFHEDSDGDSLMIDETPGKMRRSLAVDCVPTHKIKAPNFFLINGDSEHVAEMEVAGEVDVVSDAPKNGIEELLKASVLTSDSAKEGSTEDDSDSEEHLVEVVSTSSPSNSPIIRSESCSGVSSAATRDAIAGMLSFSRAIGTKHKPSSREARRLKAKRKIVIMASTDDDEDRISNVHQDDDFIYPTLDISDDEDERTQARVNSRKIDEAWSPRARVGPVTPKTNRPVRAGKKRMAVEKGLEAAAAKRANLPAPKRQYLKKKAKKSLEAKSSVSVNESTSRAVLTKSMKKPKKGMATAKQRLGKILKIHKMLSP